MTVKTNKKAIARNTRANNADARKINELTRRVASLSNKKTSRANGGFFPFSYSYLSGIFMNAFQNLITNPTYVTMVMLFLFTAISYTNDATNNVYISFLKKVFTTPDTSATYKYLVSHAKSVIGSMLVAALYTITPRSTAFVTSILGVIFVFAFVPSQILFYIIPFTFGSFYYTISNRYGRAAVVFFGLVFYFLLYEAVPSKYKF